METNPQQETLFTTIGDLARELGITTRTIRYYEERGLLTPQRSNGRQRMYTQKERGRLKLILRAKGLFSLDEVKAVFSIYDRQPDEVGEQQQFIRLHEMVRNRIAQIDQQMKELSELRQELQGHFEDIETRVWPESESDS